MVKEESDELVSGYLEAVSSAFTGSPAEAAAQGDFVKTVYAKVCTILKTSETKLRYKVVVTALQLIKDHAYMFREHLLGATPTELFAVLQQLCGHSNRDVCVAALDATDAWLGQITARLKPDSSGEHKVIFTGLWQLCNQSLESRGGNGPHIRVRCLALRGYGALAKVAKAGKTIDIVKMWKKLAEQVKLILINIVTDADADAEHMLPDLTIALADFILQLPGELSESDLDMLNSLAAMLLAEYRTVLNARRFLFHRAFYLLLYALSQSPERRALPLFLERTMYRQTMESVKPEVAAGYTRPGVPARGHQKPQPCFRYSDFWASLGDRDKSTRSWLRKRAAVAGSLDEAHGRIQQLVYTRIWQAVTRIVTKLDFTIADQLPEGADDIASQGGGGEGEDGEMDGSDGGLVSEGRVFQASGMTGHERPQNPRDVEIFLNLVDFVKQLLDNVAPEYFRDSCYVFCDTMIKLSSRNALFSGFFKLLSAAMKAADKGAFFRGLSLAELHRYDGRHSTVAGMRGAGVKEEGSERDGAADDMEADPAGGGRGEAAADPEASKADHLQLCFIITSKFADEVSAGAAFVWAQVRR